MLFILPILANAQINRAFYATGYSPPQYPPISGETSFAMTDIPNEQIPNLYLTWDVPKGRNLSLLVYVHGWDGGGSIASGFDATGRQYLKDHGIAFLGIGMRGRNTGASYAQTHRGLPSQQTN